jgi:SAM-dependent methyltransferase
MAELEREASSCCDDAARDGCCEPGEKTGCCTPGAATCGCDAGEQDVREQVRARYAAAALAIGARGGAGGAAVEDHAGRQVFGDALYGEAEREDAAVAASLGCGVPTAVADLSAGETVLDLGSGAGGDVLISARRVGPGGRAIGLDMTEEMLELARRNARAAGLENAEFRKGYIEEIPLPDDSVDVVISNCVLNLSGDKPKVIREAARVLRPGGRFAISDVVADPDMDEATRADMRQWTGCIAGALTREEFAAALTDAGLTEVEIRETHRVHEHAGAAIIRARKPQAAASAGCSLSEHGLRDQLARYKSLGARGRLIERANDRLAIEIPRGVDAGEIEDLMAVERDCCPFFELTWDPSERLLRISVGEQEHEPALDAIATALGAPA